MVCCVTRPMMKKITRGAHSHPWSVGAASPQRRFFFSLKLPHTTLLWSLAIFFSQEHKHTHTHTHTHTHMKLYTHRHTHSPGRISFALLPVTTHMLHGFFQPSRPQHFSLTQCRYIYTKGWTRPLTRPPRLATNPLISSMH
jgi:hypothetical protein